MSSYTHGHAEPVLASHRWRTAENSAPHLLAHLRPGLSVLDVGCGPGTVTVDLAERVAPGRVVGVDAAEAPLGEARALAARRGVAVTFVAGDVHDLEAVLGPVEVRAAEGGDGGDGGDGDSRGDGRFDVVHAHQVLQHLPDPVGALRAMAARVRPGGLLAVRDVDYAATTWYPADPGLDRWLELYRDVARADGGEPDAGRHLLAWARAAGLDPAATTATASAWCFATPAERAWWGTSWAGRITSSSVAEHALAHGLSTRPELEGLAAAWRRWAAADDGWLALLHAELLVRC